MPSSPPSIVWLIINDIIDPKLDHDCFKIEIYQRSNVHHHDHLHRVPFRSKPFVPLPDGQESALSYDVSIQNNPDVRYRKEPLVAGGQQSIQHYFVRGETIESGDSRLWEEKKKMTRKKVCWQKRYETFNQWYWNIRMNFWRYIKIESKLARTKYAIKIVT